MATLRSFRDARVSRLLREGQPAARIEGRVRSAAGTRTLSWQWADGSRKLALDGVNASTLGEWFAAVRAVLFCPEHLSVVRGEPEERRRFLDRAVFTARPGHLDLVRDYRRVVSQKVALLRAGGVRSGELDAWDSRLVALGARVAVRRWEMVQELLDPFQLAYREMTGGGRERVALRVRSAGGEPDGEAAVAARLTAALGRSRPDELRVGRSLVGPHRDDLSVEIEGRSARRFASQGQARTAVLALKLAELEAARRRGEAPLFLLDDLTSELDRGRRERLVTLLSAMDNQVWVTTTDPAYLGPLPDAMTVRARVESGAVLSEEPRSSGDRAPVDVAGGSG